MLTSMTLAEIQAKYSEIHTPEEIEQFHQNMKNSNKWKVVKNFDDSIISAKVEEIEISVLVFGM